MPPIASVGKLTVQLAIQIVVLAMEDVVVLHVDDDVEVARRAAGGAVLALAVQAQALAGRDAGGNLRRDLALAADASGAAAGLARLADDLAGAAARRAGARDGQEALLEAQLARAVALRADFRRAAGRRAGAAAGLAGLLARNLDRRLGAGERFLERDLEVVAQIGAALRSAALARRRRSRRDRRGCRRCPRSRRTALGSKPPAPAPLTPAWPKRS